MTKHIDMIRDLVDHIEGNLSEDIQIVGLAESFALSPWHFQRLFKSLVGDSLGSYIRGRRLTHAAELLLRSEHGIIDIALEVGFGSHEAFTRAFKAQFGLTPKDFRATQPSVLLQQKPLLTPELLQHLASAGLREPRIIERPAQLLVGFASEIPSPFAIEAGHCESMSTSWLKLVDRQDEVRNREPGPFHALFLSPSGKFTEEALSYFVGVPVSSLDEVPEGMSTHEIPAQTIASFERPAQLDQDTVRRNIDAIYGYWLPNSNYERGVGNDYELVHGVLKRPIPDFSVIQYCVPLV